ncbi:MAG: hypothetical protein IPJ86_16485 [Bacteroidetes bacterium]|nr:hypothetical protein [Bacteroidota bacterium]
MAKSSYTIKPDSSSLLLPHQQGKKSTLILMQKMRDFPSGFPFLRHLSGRSPSSTKG